MSWWSRIIGKPETDTVSFGYQKKQFDGLEIPEPVATLGVETKFGWLDIKFLVDTGADFTILPLNPYGSLIGFEPDEEQAIKISGVSRSFVAYPGEIRLKIGDESHSVRVYFARVRSMPLLGRLDIWSRYTVQFDNQRQQTEFFRIGN